MRYYSERIRYRGPLDTCERISFSLGGVIQRRRAWDADRRVYLDVYDVALMQCSQYLTQASRLASVKRARQSISGDITMPGNRAVPGTANWSINGACREADPSSNALSS